MATFENESEAFQDRNYRQRLNRNWANGNAEFDAVNKRIDELGNTDFEGSNEVTNARTDVHGKTSGSLSARLDSDQLTAENALSIANDKADMEEVQQVINQIVSGAPQGTFPTLDSLKKAYPNGAKGVYLTEDNGHWCFWNGNAWTDGGEYVSNVVNFSNADFDFPGVNLLNGTSSNIQVVTIDDSSKVGAMATNGKYFRLHPGRTYTYHSMITNAPRDGYCLIDIYNNKDVLIKQLKGNNYRNQTNGLSKITFTADNSMAYVNFSPYATGQAFSGQVTWQSEMLEPCGVVSDYARGIGDMNVADGVAFLLKLTQGRRELNDIVLEGVNLLRQTRKDAQTYRVNNESEVGTPTVSFSDPMPVKANTDYIYHVRVDKAPADGYCLIVLMNKDKQRIRNVNGWHYQNDSQSRSWAIFNTGDDVKYIVVRPVAFTKPQTGDVTWSEEMLEYGDVIHDWVPALSEMNAIPAVASILDKLAADKGELLHRNILDNTRTPGINLLTGTTKQNQSRQANNSYNIGSWASNALLYKVEPNTTYTYHSKIKEAPSNAYCVIGLLDKDTNRLTNVHGENYLDGRNGLSSVTFSTGDTVKYLQIYPVGFPSPQTGKATWSEEMLEYGNIPHEHTLALSEMSMQDAFGTVINKAREASRDTITANEVGLPIINIDGDTSGLLNSNTKSILPFTFAQNNRVVDGFVQTEWQGNSSKGLPKKGFKFKTFKDVDAKDKLKWQPTPLMPVSHNFQLKAYYTDKYHIRDLASAEILSWFIANDPHAPVRLLQANQFGTITGQPCLVYFNEEFYGLGTIKTHTGSTMYNIDDTDTNQIVLENNGQAGSTWTTATPTIGDDGDFTLESDTDTNAQTALNTLADFIVNSSDADFVANAKTHFDENSLFDYILFNYLVNNSDAWTGKNEVIITYDAKKWYVMPYDFDSSLNAHWTPGNVNPIDRDYFDTNFIKDNLLLKVIRLMPDRLLARFNDLEKAGVLNIVQLQNVINKRVSEIGQGAYSMEWERWSDNPAYQLDTPVDDMKRMFVVRKNLLKNKLNAMQK